MHGEMERLNAALAALGGLGGPEGKAKRSLAPQRAEAYVIGRSQENRSVSSGRNGRKTSEPGEWKRTGEADSVTVQHPPW